ncbi:PAS domain S-box protein [Emcibacter sp. SYSU 3D8]|uniref:PAS domain-containing sensor histidine kinase n=1 Tax=Emcibacter sp. SYSU 3D8 TaxID=3133969 RepID=UPI0031FF35AB
MKRVQWMLLAAFLLALLAQTALVVASLFRNNALLRSLGRDFNKRDEEREAVAQHNFAALLDAVPDATFVMQAGGEILLANAEAERLFGYGRDELVGRSIESLMPDDRLDDFRAVRPGFIEKLANGPFTVDRALVGRARDGREFATEVRLSPLETSEGRLVLAGVRDVADRELERENQSARDEYLRLATERSGVGVWHWKIDDDDFQWSDAFRQIFGINAALTPSNEAFRALIHPDDLDRLTESVSAAIRDYQPYQLEYRIVRPDGAVRNIAARGSALYDDQGEAVRMTGLVQDITRRKEDEEALRVSEERFRRIFEEGPMGIALVDTSSRFVSVNETLCQMVEYSAEELYALTFKDITHPDDLDADVNLAEQVFRGDIDHYDIQKRYFVKTGGIIWVNLTVSVLRDMAGGVSYALAMIENITERKRLEEELEAHRLSIVSSARLSAIGSMAGGIAHEINNPVAIISASAENIEDMVEDDDIDVEELALNAKRIGEMCDRTSKIVNSMRHISREGEGDLMHAASIRSIVDGTLALCAERYKLHSIRLDVPVIDSSAMIVCREVQVSQVLLNLLQNAFDAVVADAPHAWVRLDVDMLEDTVEFRVVDSGTGIGEDIKAKIMEPFFTTKPVGQGTGLGLSLSSTIAQQHGGRLEVGERDGHTCFTLVLSRMKEGQKSCN